MPTRNKQKSDSVESILDFLQQGESYPKEKKEDEEEDENIFEGLDDGSSTPIAPSNMTTASY